MDADGLIPESFEEAIQGAIAQGKRVKFPTLFRISITQQALP